MIKMVMTMYKNEEFIQAEALLMVLTLLSLFTSPYPYLCMLVAGVLMVVFTLRSLSEETDRLIFAVQVMLSAVFAAAAGEAFSFLIFYECRLGKRPGCKFFSHPLSIAFTVRQHGGKSFLESSAIC